MSRQTDGKDEKCLVNCFFRVWKIQNEMDYSVFRFFVRDGGENMNGDDECN